MRTGTYRVISDFMRFSSEPTVVIYDNNKTRTRGQDGRRDMRLSAANLHISSPINSVFEL